MSEGTTLSATCVVSPTSHEYETYRVYLRIEPDNVLMLNTDQKIIEKWPLPKIRKYIQKGKRVTIEAGRRCPNGEGVYIFDLDGSHRVLHMLDNYIKRIEQNRQNVEAMNPRRQSGTETPSRKESALFDDRKDLFVQLNPRPRARTDPSEDTPGPPPLLSQEEVRCSSMGSRKEIRQTQRSRSSLSHTSHTLTPPEIPRRSSDLQYVDVNVVRKGSVSMEEAPAAPSRSTKPSGLAPPIVTQTNYVEIDLKKTKALANAIRQPRDSDTSDGSAVTRETRHDTHLENVEPKESVKAKTIKATTKDILNDVSDLLADLDDLDPVEDSVPTKKIPPPVAQKPRKAQKPGLDL
eukprot:m.33379 g.33379  ORF g.33379 m.33379 type:complete len:349 (-) comp8527_c0_seq4:66-1112(-)